MKCCMVSSAVGLIVSIAGVLAAGESCVSRMDNNNIICSSKETALTYVEILKQVEECTKLQTKTGCADQSGCAWQEGPQMAEGPQVACVSQILFDQSQERSKNVKCMSLSSKDACGKNTGCVWNQPYQSCVLQSSLTQLESATFWKDQFCSSTDKEVCDAADVHGDNCQVEKVSMTKEVCDGRSISPWVSNACDWELHAMSACVAKLEDIPNSQVCDKAKEELLCAQANPCYEFQPPGPLIKHSMKASCDHPMSPGWMLNTRWSSPPDKCELQCSLPDSVKKSNPVVAKKSNPAAASAAADSNGPVGAGAFACVVALVVV